MEAILARIVDYPEQDHEAVIEAVLQLSTAVFVLNTLLKYEEAGRAAGKAMIEAVKLASLVNGVLDAK